MRLTLISLAILLALMPRAANAVAPSKSALNNASASPLLIADAADAKQLDAVQVRGVRATSLPSQIPTTIEGITGEEVAEKINATDAQDALKYFPSLLVRKRYIGDYDHAVLASRASGTGNSARSLVYADGVLLSNLLGNGATFTPRWGLVTPEEIERVDVLYGPFSAAYSGNSVGAVVDYITRMPQAFEAHAKLGYYTQDFELYGTDDRFSAQQYSASIGSRSGALSWWLNVNRLNSDGQPIAYATRLTSLGVAGPTGSAIPVTGAVLDRDPRERPWYILGATNAISTVQDHAKLKVAYDFTDETRLSYLYGRWNNDVVRNSESYLRDANGNPVYNGPVVIDGNRFTLTPSDISSNRGDLAQDIHAVSLKSARGEQFDYSMSASWYDYLRDDVRSPLVARPLADTSGAGRIASLEGTSWKTLWAAGTWRSAGAQSTEEIGHIIDFGVQRDSAKLVSNVFDTGDWLRGARGARFAGFGGKTELSSIYVQDTWRFAPQWLATLGLRAERWEARNGLLANATRSFAFSDRSDTALSPKAALAFEISPAWQLQGSFGRAQRNPTVSELYQGSIVTNAVVNNDPNLKPERSNTFEFSSRNQLAVGDLRSTFFFERTRDALYSQTNVNVVPNVTNIQNVDEITTHGLEFAYSGSDLWIEGFDFQSSLTYADSEITANRNFPASVGKRQPRVPKWRANLLASYRFSDALSGSFGVRYSGRQFGTLDNIDTNEYTYTSVSRFLVADVRGVYRFNEHISTSFGIDNLNNESYWAFHPYPQRTYAMELKFDY
jgi:iron complex outermembrane receptor protein